MPSELTLLLGTTPTVSYGKGEVYRRVAGRPDVKGRTGIWLYSTEGHSPSGLLADHLALIERLIAPSRPGSETRRPLEPLMTLMARSGLSARVSCFWTGLATDQEPVVPASFRKLVEPISAEIETDFERDFAVPHQAKVAVG